MARRRVKRRGGFLVMIGKHGHKMFTDDPSNPNTTVETQELALDKDDIDRIASKVAELINIEPGRGNSRTAKVTTNKDVVRRKRRNTPVSMGITPLKPQDISGNIKTDTKESESNIDSAIEAMENTDGTRDRREASEEHPSD
jgi:hypothetical protein